MSETHINAYVQEARERLLTAEAAVKDARESFDALEAQVRGEQVAEATPPAEPSPASEGEADTKTKKVKYR